MLKDFKNPLVWIPAALAVCVLVLAAIAGFQGFAATYRWLEVTAALLASALIIGITGLFFFGLPAAPVPPAASTPAIAPLPSPASTPPPTDPDRGVANAVAFNAVIFVVLGFAAIVAATPRWVVGSFWGGTFLLAGGFVGLLFGIPLHVDKDGTSSTNLMVDTANAASKLVAGATLAQLKPIYQHFQSMTAYLGYCLECCANDWYRNGAARNYNSSLAGGIILYFSLAGFLAGILLPKFFFDTSPPAPSPVAPTRPASVAESQAPGPAPETEAGAPG
jgi:hypothetical protein